MTDRRRPVGDGLRVALAAANTAVAATEHESGHLLRPSPVNRWYPVCV